MTENISDEQRLKIFKAFRLGLLQGAPVHLSSPQVRPGKNEKLACNQNTVSDAFCFNMGGVGHMKFDTPTFVLNAGSKRKLLELQLSSKKSGNSNTPSFQPSRIQRTAPRTPDSMSCTSAIPTSPIKDEEMEEKDVTHKVLENLHLVQRIAGYLDLELHEAMRLGLTSKAWSHFVKFLPIRDINLTQSVENLMSNRTAIASRIDSSLASISDVQLETTARLICNPHIFYSSCSSLQRLRVCTNLEFLILSLQGYNLDLPGTPQDPWHKLPFLMCQLPHLVCLDISNCHITDRHLEVIACHCRGLKALDLSYNQLITDAGIASLLSVCSNLQELDMSACDLLGDASLVAAGTHLPHLVRLYLERDAAWEEEGETSERLASSGFAFSSSGLARVAQGCNELQVLSLAGRDNWVVSGEVPGVAGDAGLLSLADRCRSLASLDLSACTWVDSASLHYLSSHLPCLTNLCLSGGRDGGPSDIVLEQLGRHCPNLASLHLYACSSVSEEGLARALDAAHELRDLELVSCTNVSEDFAVRASAKWPLLQVLHIMSHSDADEAMCPAPLVDVTNVNSTPSKASQQQHCREGLKAFNSPVGGVTKEPRGWQDLMSFLTRQASNMHV